MLVGGWLFTGAALVMTLARPAGLQPGGALLMVALARLVLAALVLLRLRLITRNLTFRESRASVNSLLTYARPPVDGAERAQQEK